MHDRHDKTGVAVQSSTKEIRFFEKIGFLALAHTVDRRFEQEEIVYSPLFHRFHRWLFTFNPVGVTTLTKFPNPEGVKHK